MNTRRRSLLCFVALVLLLVGSSGLWVRGQQQQYALNRQLIAALFHNDTVQALALVNAGADPNTCPKPTPAPTLKLLLDQWRHRNQSSVNNSVTAFMLACGMYYGAATSTTFEEVSLEENLPLVQTMLRHGADVHASTEVGETALHSAVAMGREPTVELLLQHGANVNAQNFENNTALIAAVTSDAEAMAHLLLTHGANPNVQNVYGNSALHIAISSADDASLVRELLAHGANLNVKNQDGDTPLTLARKKKRLDLVALLRKGGK